MNVQDDVQDDGGRRLDQIRLTGISATGYHGVFAHERREGQTFVADVVVHTDTRRAAAGDDLAHTVDYGALAELVAAVLTGEPADLIETVAERIAATVLARPGVQAVDVALHKPQAPITVPFDDVVVSIRRDRTKLPAAEPYRPTSGPVRRSGDGARPRTASLPVTSPAPLPTTDAPAALPAPPPVAPPSPVAPPPGPEPVRLGHEGPDGGSVVVGPAPTGAVPTGVQPTVLPAPSAGVAVGAAPGHGTGRPDDRVPDLGATQLMDPVYLTDDVDLVDPEGDVVEGELVHDALDEPPAAPVQTVLALGANLGAAQDTLRRAVADLASTPGVELVAVSPLARTAAVGPEQPDYLNAVVLARTTLAARDLLRAVHAVEQAHGRERTEHWGPRTLDVDIIVYGDTLAVTDDLELPHPRAHERAFVLEPWAQVDPDAVLPGLGGGPVAQLAATAPDRDGVRWMALDWLTAPVPAAIPEPDAGDAGEAHRP